LTFQTPQKSARIEPGAREGRFVLDNVSEQDFLDMERRWLKLARSLELTERLESSSKNRPKFDI
jgi:hypothetical protein